MGLGNTSTKVSSLRAPGWTLALAMLLCTSHSQAAEITVAANSNYFSGWSFSSFPPSPAGGNYWYYLNNTGLPGPDVSPAGGGQTVGDFNGNQLTWTVDPPSRLITAGVWVGGNSFGNTTLLPANIGAPSAPPGQGFISRGTASFSSPAPFRQGSVLFMQDVDGNENFKFHFLDCAGNAVDSGDFDFLKIATSGTPSYFIEGAAPAQFWRVTSAVGNDPNTVNGIVIKSADVCRIGVDGDKPSIGGSVNLFLGSPPNMVPTAVPAISGTPKVGSTVTGSYTYADQDNNEQDTTATGTSYKFVTSSSSTLTNSSAGTVVASGSTGGSSATYTPVADDEGQYLYFCVTPIAAAGANPGLEVCTPVGQVAKGSTDGGNPGNAQPVPSLSAISLIGLTGVLGLLGARRRRRLS